MNSHLSTLFFFFYCLWFLCQMPEIITKFNAMKIFPYFSRSFSVSSTFTSLIHIELVFLTWSKVSAHFHADTICWKQCPLCILKFDYIYVSLFLDSLFYFYQNMCGFILFLFCFVGFFFVVVVRVFLPLMS